MRTARLQPRSRDGAARLGPAAPGGSHQRPRRERLGSGGAARGGGTAASGMSDYELSVDGGPVGPVDGWTLTWLDTDAQNRPAERRFTIRALPGRGLRARTGW